MSQRIKCGIASALLDRFESCSFIVFLDHTEYGLVAWMFHRIKYDTNIEIINCLECGYVLVIVHCLNLLMMTTTVLGRRKGRGMV